VNFADEWFRRRFRGAYRRCFRDAGRRFRGVSRTGETEAEGGGHERRTESVPP
jgi:hypothetical protein